MPEELKGLTIQVIGQTNTGKTTVATLIRDVLRENGFENVTLKDLDPSPNKESIAMRVAKTKKRPILIEVIAERKPRT